MTRLASRENALDFPAAASAREERGPLRPHSGDGRALLLGADVFQQRIEGGLDIVVTARGRVADAARRFVFAQAAELSAVPGWSARATPLPGGVRLVVTADAAPDGIEARRIRGLGFAGLIAVAAHAQARRPTRQPAA